MLYLHAYTNYIQNTAWKVNIKLGVMTQPGGNGTPHPLWAPRELEKIPQLIKDWRKHVANLPDLPELKDLLEDYSWEVEDMDDKAIKQMVRMSEFEASRGEGSYVAQTGEMGGLTVGEELIDGVYRLPKHKREGSKSKASVRDKRAKLDRLRNG